MAGYFARAVVCESGHLITRNAEKDKHLLTPFCTDCGKKPIDKCQHCGKEIRGEEFAERNDIVTASAATDPACGPQYESLGFQGVPKYCPSCGKPYPWTQTAIEAAVDYIDTLTVLDPTERSEMKTAVANIVADSPKSVPAARRLVQLLRKAGEGALKFIQDVLAGVVCEAAKREIWR